MSDGQGLIRANQHWNQEAIYYSKTYGQGDGISRRGNWLIIINMGHQRLFSFKDMGCKSSEYLQETQNKV